MNKAIQVCVAGSVLFGAISITYGLGEGTMLGLLAKHNLNPNEAIEALKETGECSISSTIRQRFVRLVALTTAKES